MKHPRFPRVFSLLPVLLLLLSAAVARAAALDEQVRRELAAAKLKQTQVSLCMLELPSGRTLAAVDEQQSLIPASNMKLVTTAAALDVLGPEFRFQTELRLISPEQWNQGGAGITVTDPVLLVRGDGDPSFGDPNLLARRQLDVEALLQIWVRAVSEAGVKKLSLLYVDDRIFDRQLVHPKWPAEQLNHWYCAQVSGLLFNDNCLDIYASPTSAGQPPIIRMMPAAPFLHLTNNAVTGSENAFWVSRQPGSNALTFMGKVKQALAEPVNITVDNPPLFFGQVLAHHLQSAGIAVGTVTLPGYGERLPEGKPLHYVQAQLPLLLGRCNKDSQNLFAEALMKRMGHQASGEPGSWANGAQAIAAMLKRRLGAMAQQVQVADGSGMSRDNRISAGALATLLWSMQQDPARGPVYLQSLSIAGEDGTLRKRLRDGVHGQVYGKSGFINGVSSLSGYIVPAGGTQPAAAFSLLFNDIKGPVSIWKIKEVQDKLVRILDAYVQRNPPIPAAAPR